MVTLHLPVGAPELYPNKKFSFDWKVGGFGLVIQPLSVPGTKLVNRGFGFDTSCVRA
jgi:hypothetical protein